MNLTKRKSYWFRLFVALSLVLCAIFGGRMYESACASAWRLRNEKGIKGLWARCCMFVMDYIDADHCETSAEYWNKIQRGLNQ